MEPEIKSGNQRLEVSTSESCEFSLVATPSEAADGRSVLPFSPAPAPPARGAGGRKAAVPGGQRGAGGCGWGWGCAAGTGPAGLSAAARCPSLAPALPGGAVPRALPSAARSPRSFLVRPPHGGSGTLQGKEPGRSPAFPGPRRPPRAGPAVPGERRPGGAARGRAPAVGLPPRVARGRPRRCRGGSRGRSPPGPGGSGDSGGRGEAAGRGCCRRLGQGRRRPKRAGGAENSEEKASAPRDGAATHRCLQQRFGNGAKTRGRPRGEGC